jgi:hypothetical protein
MTMTKVKHPGVIFAALFLFLALAASAYAHATVLWCYVENNRVYVEAFFMGGAKVQNGTIIVADKNGKKLLEGKTDKQGLFNFAPPVQDDMTIVLKVDSGHGADFMLTKQDFLDAAQDATEGN